MLRKLLSNQYFLLFFIILISFWLYRDTLNAYFFQDDWFSLRISRANNLYDFSRFFLPRSDVIYYRPLGMQVPFFAIEKLFGVNPLAFHIFSLLTHAINIVLVFLLILSISKNKFSAIISAYLYGTSLVHYIPLYWSATYAFILGPTVFFLSFLFYIKFINNHSRKVYYLSFFLFFLGLFVNELVIILPVLLALYLWLVKRKSSVKPLFPFFAIATIFLLIRFYLFPPPTEGNYEISLGKHILNNLEAYLLWSYNWSEEMKAQLVNFFSFNPQFIKDFKAYFMTLTASLIINILFLYILPALLVVRYEWKKISGLTFFCSLWFLLGLSPVLLFPKHVFSYYLPISLVGLLLISTTFFSTFISLIYHRIRWMAYIIVIIFLANWFYTSYVSFDFNRNVHWAPRRAQLAGNLVQNAKEEYSKPDVLSVLYVRDLPEYKLALNDQDAMVAITGRDNFKTVYTDHIQNQKRL